MRPRARTFFISHVVHRIIEEEKKTVVKVGKLLHPLSRISQCFGLHRSRNVLSLGTILCAPKRYGSGHSPFETVRK